MPNRKNAQANFRLDSTIARRPEGIPRVADRSTKAVKAEKRVKAAAGQLSAIICPVKYRKRLERIAGQ